MWPDAIQFTPKRKVVMMGFGLTNNYNKKDFYISFQWHIEGGEKSEKVQVDVT